MLVTKTEEVSKARLRVELDNEFAFVLYKGEVRRFHVVVDEELLPEYYDEIITQILPKRVKLRCMNLLTKKDYTEAKLREKLRGDYTEELVDLAITYVKSFGYLDDRRYALDYATYHMEYKSRKQLEFNLQKKGIQKELIREVLQEVLGDDSKQEVVLILKWLEKKRFVKEDATPEHTNRMIQFLMRKGFSYGNIKHAVHQLEWLQELDCEG